MPRADRSTPTDTPPEQPSESTTVAEPAPEPPAKQEPAPVVLPAFARVAAGKTVHTARGAIGEHQLIEARDVGGTEALAELVKAGSATAWPPTPKT